MSSIKMNAIEDLVESALIGGCKVSRIQNKEAVEFVQLIKEAKQSGKYPNLERASEILKDTWDIDIPRRALSTHCRGKCGCRKK
jgi:hypothetical protein